MQGFGDEGRGCEAENVVTSKNCVCHRVEEARTQPLPRERMLSC
jgi:hypothetical protein